MNTIKQILITLLLMGVLGFGFLLWAEYKVNQITETVESKIDDTIDEVTGAPGRMLAPIGEAFGELGEYASSGEMEKDFGESDFYKNWMALDKAIFGD